MKNQIPPKPEDEKNQISMLWEACFNHLPHQINFLNIKMNFTLAFLALVLALLGIILGVVIFK